MTAERWAAIPGYEGIYEVSDLGRVRSLDRKVQGPLKPQTVRGRIMRGGHNGRYRTVMLSRAGQIKNCTIHSLVLLAFVGPRPEGLDACHNDGDHLNNALGNLRWDTREANMEDLREHAGFWQSHKTHCKWGHPFDEENTAYTVNAKGRVHRRCRACSYQRSHAFRALARERAA